MSYVPARPNFVKMGVRLLPVVILAFAGAGIGLTTASQTQAAPFGLPAGFKAEVYATGLHIPRFVSFSPEGDLYVAEFGLTNNSVKVLPDRNHNGKPDNIVTFAAGSPAGTSPRRGPRGDCAGCSSPAPPR